MHATSLSTQYCERRLCIHGTVLKTVCRTLYQYTPLSGTFTFPSVAYFWQFALFLAPSRSLFCSFALLILLHLFGSIFLASSSLLHKSCSFHLLPSFCIIFLAFLSSLSLGLSFQLLFLVFFLPPHRL